VSFNSDISSWNVSKVVNFGNMFSGAAAFNQPLSSWEPRSGANFVGMFSRATSFNQNLCAWNDVVEQTIPDSGIIFAGSGCDEEYVDPIITLGQFGGGSDTPYALCQGCTAAAP